MNSKFSQPTETDVSAPPHAKYDIKFAIAIILVLVASTCTQIGIKFLIDARYVRKINDVTVKAHSSIENRLIAIEGRVVEMQTVRNDNAAAEEAAAAAAAAD